MPTLLISSSSTSRLQQQLAGGDSEPLVNSPRRKKRSEGTDTPTFRHGSPLLSRLIRCHRLLLHAPPQIPPLQVPPSPFPAVTADLCEHLTPPVVLPTLLPCTRPRFPCRVSSSTGSTREAFPKVAAQLGKVRIRIGLEHQVEFGETVVVFGSHRPLGSWRKGVPMVWTEGGWVTDVELDGGDFVEYKFVVVSDDGETKIWEDGENRVLEVPRAGVFDVVCRWNMTEETVDLIGTVPDDHAGEVEEEEEESDEPGDAEEGIGSVEDVEQRPAMEQQQGRSPAASSVRTNEHRSCRETERPWDAEGLEGVPPLKLQVEGDRGGRNWWRKVNAPETSHDMIDVLLSISQVIFLLVSALYRAI